MKKKIIIQIAFCLFGIFICVGIYVYPKFTHVIFIDSWPEKWSSDLYLLNHKEIIEKIGPPDEDAAAKDYQSWLKKESWGTYQMKILFKNCCDDRTIPERIVIYVRLNGRYNPIETKVLPRKPA